MGGRQAADTRLAVRLEALRARGQRMSEREQEALVSAILETYGREASPYYGTARLWDDGIIDPVETRRVLALGIAAALNAPIGETAYGVFRM